MTTADESYNLRTVNKSEFYRFNINYLGQNIWGRYFFIPILKSNERYVNLVYLEPIFKVGQKKNQ